MRWVLVPVDGSAGANAAAALSVELARGLRAGILLLHVYDAPTAAALGLAHLSEEDVEKVKADIAGGAFESARRAIGDSPEVTIETLVAMGNPGHEIVTQAQVSSAEMVVMGSRGLSALKSWLLGSVSQYVLHHAHCPVVIVPPEGGRGA